jgi:hypothetical protein
MYIDESSSLDLQVQGHSSTTPCYSSNYATHGGGDHSSATEYSDSSESQKQLTPNQEHGLTAVSLDWPVVTVLHVLAAHIIFVVLLTFV